MRAVKAKLSPDSTRDPLLLTQAERLLTAFKLSTGSSGRYHTWLPCLGWPPWGLRS